MADQIDCTWVDNLLANDILPGHILVSILTNLPVKSLLRFKAVCKGWHSLISSSVFIKTHLNRQSVGANTLLLLSWTDIEYNEDMEYDEDEGDEDMEYDEDDFESGQDDKYREKTEFALLSHCYDMSEILPPWSYEGVYVVDTCKSLVCIRYSRGCVDEHISWNPATRRYRSLNLPNKPYCQSFSIEGLGFVEATNDYKIVATALTHPAFDPCMFVYTLSSDSWKELDYDFQNFPACGSPVQPTFINRCLHWLGDTCTCSSMCTCSIVVNMICAFDVQDEVMCCFGVPDNYDPRSNLSMQTLVIKRCLSVAIFPESEL